MTADVHSQATDLLCKALACPSDQRLRLIEEVLAAAGEDMSRSDRKKIQEVVRKVCALRDQLAIQLYDVEVIDPRQLVLDIDHIRPNDFR